MNTKQKTKAIIAMVTLATLVSIVNAQATTAPEHTTVVEGNHFFSNY